MDRRYLLRHSLLFGGAALNRASGAPFSGEDERGRPGPSIADTQYGKVRGLDVRGVRVFKGIPYGGATGGTGRFLPPSKPKKWTGVLDCSENGPRCVQGSGNIFLNPRIGEYFRGSKDRAEMAQQRDSENCLVLNVLAPGSHGKRPVMAYIHGGGYTSGSGLLTVFADAFPREHDVVLVGINHRLNVFGYLYLGEISDKYSIGNAGQLDLVAALEWIRDNVANFGGDPNNVTIFGESGGGGKISTLMAMPQAKGLYHKAIVESGSMLRVAEKEQATFTAKTLLSRLGIDPTRLEQLERVPPAQLLAASSRGGAAGAVPAMRYGPVVDGHSVPRQTWSPAAPAISAAVPMIIGTCKDETTLFSLNDEALFRLDDAALRHRIIEAGVPESDAGKLIGDYRRDHPTATPSDIWFRFAADRGARSNAVKQAELKLQQRAANVYVYYFAWDTPCDDGKIKAFHTAELPLAMRLVRYPESEQLSRQISGAWAAFARNGRPDHGGLPAWRPYSMSDRATMIFDAKASRVESDPDRDERVILRALPPRGLL